MQALTGATEFPSIAKSRQRLDRHYTHDDAIIARDRPPVSRGLRNPRGGSMTKFATVIRYGNADRIAEVRPTHREYLSALKEQGKLWASGPFEDDSGALIIYEAESQEDAEALIKADPFHEAGVFQSWEMKPWRQVF
jgi:uncharacterized protein YciI